MWGSHERFDVSREEFFFFFVTAGPVKAAYVPLVEDQAIRSSLFFE